MSHAEINTKKLYEELISEFRESPTAQAKYNEMFPCCELNWSKIYSLPFQVALDTYTGSFQFKPLNRILSTNTKLCKFGIVDSPLCTFCGKEDEIPEHSLALCCFSVPFWQEISSWLKQCYIHLDIDLTDQVNIIFRLIDIDDELSYYITL